MCDHEKLIFLIESRPAIYNYTLKDHSDKRVIEGLWEEIASEMKCTGKLFETKFIPKIRVN